MKNHTPIEDGLVTVDSAAWISMHSLSDELRDNVLRTLNELAALPPQQWPTDKVRPHWSVPALYVLNAPDNLRVFFRRKADGGIAIAHLVNQETLDLYFLGKLRSEVVVKDFLSIAFNHHQCLQEVLALRDLLAAKTDLEENRDIKPFFEANRQLAAFLGSFSGGLYQFDLLAYQYQLFGDFSCDLVVGDSRRHTYGFVEFEEAMATSIFRRQGQKATLEWSSCFEHGHSQLIDWFWKMDDMAHTDDFEARFGRRRAPYFGLLVIGRSSALTTPREQQRWEWRRRKVLVNSLPIFHVTYDELCHDLLAQLQAFSPPGRTGPGA